jgi:hypothetical protein
MSQLHQADLRFCFDSATLTPRLNTLRLRSDCDNVGDRGAVVCLDCLEVESVKTSPGFELEQHTILRIWAGAILRNPQVEI